MAKPSYPFYPDDWMNDLGLRGCSPASRGIWADLLCMMHQGVPYGHLADPAGPVPIKMVALRCGVTIRSLVTAIAELELHNVFSRTDAGTIYSRRMVRDEHNRIVRGHGGVSSLLNPSVPRPKGIHEGILPKSAVVPSFGPEEVKEEVKELVLLKNEEKASYEEINIAWKWYKAEYPGEVNEFTDLRLFLAVIETPKDIADLYKNLPLWKATKRWQEGFHKESKNFLSERVFKIIPKVREPTESKLSASAAALKWAREEEAKHAGDRQGN